MYMCIYFNCPVFFPSGSAAMAMANLSLHCEARKEIVRTGGKKRNAYIYLYIHVFICTHTHTHTHIYIYVYIDK